jgi:hypothetical protein
MGHLPKQQNQRKKEQSDEPPTLLKEANVSGISAKNGIASRILYRAKGQHSSV